MRYFAELLRSDDHYLRLVIANEKTGGGFDEVGAVEVRAGGSRTTGSRTTVADPAVALEWRNLDISSF